MTGNDLSLPVETTTINLVAKPQIVRLENEATGGQASLTVQLRRFTIMEESHLWSQIYTSKEKSVKKQEERWSYGYITEVESDQCQHHCPDQS